MPALVDTHCHLADAAFAGDLGEVLARGAAAGVRHVVVIGETPERAADALRLTGTHPGLSATAGLHPHEARHFSATVLAELERICTDPRVVAIGETGLDYHYEHSPRETQQRAFEAQLELGRRAAKPVVIHAREADEDLAAILRSHPGVTAVMHSYSSGPTLLDVAVRLGHYVGLSGMITFRSWSLDRALAAVPPERLLLETDAPYLAPVPHRGRRNEPAFLVATAARLAQVLGVELDEAAALTTANAARAFGPRIAMTTC